MHCIVSAYIVLKSDPPLELSNCIIDFLFLLLKIFQDRINLNIEYVFLCSGRKYSIVDGICNMTWHNLNVYKLVHARTGFHLVFYSISKIQTSELIFVKQK